MQKIDEWNGKTQSPPHEFHVEFYQDIKAGDFVAKIETQLLEWPEYYGGDPPEMEPPHTEELRDKDLNQLRKNTEQLIMKRGGKPIRRLSS